MLAFVMAFFPQATHPDPATMNWNVLVFGVIVIFSMIYFLARGRHRYAGPVEYVKKDF
jgi:choline transport protein